MKVNNQIKVNPVWTGALVLLMLAGFAAWIYQLNVGLKITGMSNPVSWGLYIITFAFLVGLSAGGLIITALAYVMKNDRLEAVAPLGVITAVACVIGAMAIIVPDVGHPEKIINILFSGNYSSPLLWDILILVAYLLIGLFEAWLLFGKGWEKEPQRKAKIVRGMAFFLLPVAVLVHSITAWIFGLQVGRPFWFTGLMAPIFIASALVSGLALLLLVMLAARRAGAVKLTNDHFGLLGSLLAGFIALDFFLLFSELMTLNYAQGVESFAWVEALTSGRFAAFFWVEVLLGVLVPFVILVAPKLRTSTTWIAVASVLSLIGVYLKRVNIILPSFENVNIDYAPGVSLGRYTDYVSPFSNQPLYTPTWVEVTITVAAVAGVLFLITLGIGYLAAQQKAPKARAVQAAGD